MHHQHPLNNDNAGEGDQSPQSNKSAAPDSDNSEATANQLTIAQLQSSRKLLESVFDTSLIQMSVLKAERDQDGNITDFRIIIVNKELEKETGRTDLPGKLYAQEYPGIVAAGLFKLMVKAMETGEPQKLEYFFNVDGFNKWFSCMFIKLQDGLVATNLDITERKTAEQKERTLFTLLQKTEELAKSGSWEYNADTGEFLWSEGMYDLFEIEKGTPVTPYIYLDYVIPEDRHIAERLVVTITKTFAPKECILRINVHGQTKTVRVKSVVQSTSILGIDLDISASVHAEEKLQLQNRQLFKNKELLKQKDEFISIASHELKTPVTSIKAYTEILEEQFQQTNDAYSAALLQKMNLQVDRLTMLIKQLLDTSNLAAGQISLFKDTIQVNDIINERVEELQRITAKHHLLTELAELPAVIADRERIGQVLNNLIMNAIKYSPAGGKITIESNVAAKEITISVRDEGIGITKEAQERIFERFYRISNHSLPSMPGLGLGLYISAGIIDRHGGRIWVDSEEGHGSVFTFTLPLLTHS